MYRVDVRKAGEYEVHNWSATVYYFDKKLDTVKAKTALALRYKIWRLKRAHKSLTRRFNHGE